MENTNKQQLTITLSPSQTSALHELAHREGCDAEHLVTRSVDAFIVAYRLSDKQAQIADSTKQDVIIKLLVALTKMVGQVLYFVTMPITIGPPKAKLNTEGIALQWHHSEKFATELLCPPSNSRLAAKS